MTRLALAGKSSGLMAPCDELLAAALRSELNATSPRPAAPRPRNVRRLMSCKPDFRLFILQFLVIVSCKFNTARVTAVSAANCGVFNRSGTGESPTLTNFLASAGDVVKR